MAKRWPDNNLKKVCDIKKKGDSIPFKRLYKPVPLWWKKKQLQFESQQNKAHNLSRGGRFEKMFSYKVRKSPLFLEFLISYWTWVSCNVYSCCWFALWCCTALLACPPPEINWFQWKFLPTIKAPTIWWLRNITAMVKIWINVTIM